MEGDLLGLDFGPTQLSKQAASQGPQAFPQSQPVVGQLNPLTVQLPPPQMQQPSFAVQLSQPPSQIPPPAMVILPTVTQTTPSAAQHPSHDMQSGQAAADQHLSINAAANISTLSGQNSSNTQNELVWRPSRSADEIKDPVLKEIQEKFGGCWKLVRSDPYDEYLKAAGVGLFTRKLAVTGMPEQHIMVSGDSIHIHFHSTLFNQIYRFKLEECVENLVEKTRQSVFCTYKDGKLNLLMTPLDLGFNRTQEVQRYINEHGELVLIYTCGNAICRRYFTRLSDLVAPLNIVA